MRLRALQDRLGMPESEQIRQALAHWLAKHGGARPLLMDHTGAVQQIRQGQAVPVTCPDCGGRLVADQEFVFRSHEHRQPDTEEPFWSTRCAECKHRFNYFPENARTVRFDP